MYVLNMHVNCFNIAVIDVFIHVNICEGELVLTLPQPELSDSHSGELVLSLPQPELSDSHSGASFQAHALPRQMQ